jgi:hypothetical protein
MTWSPQPTISIDGVDRKSITLHDVQISYGRRSVWEQARASYARISILNNTNTDYGFDMNQTVSIKVKNTSGVDVTIFTGKTTSTTNTIAGSGSINTSTIQTITAVGPFAEMSRKFIGGSSWAKEFDTERMTRIFTDAGVTVDTVDSPAVYEFAIRAGNTQDAYSIAASFAQQADGYIYETATGSVGFANESRRFIDQRDNGYLTIPNNYILWGSVSSEKTLADIANSVSVKYNAGTESADNATSQATYGLVAASVTTELHNSADALLQAGRYLDLRAYPRTSLSSFTIPIDSSNVSDVNKDKFISMAMGEPIKITTLPTAIKNTEYRGFVEGYSFSINQYQMVMTLNTTDYTYSMTPTRWQDVLATDTWASVGAAVQWDTYDN